MNDMLRIARRGLEVLSRAPVPLFVGSAAWTLLNAMTPWLDLGPLLLGPAILGLFHVALKALRDQETTCKSRKPQFLLLKLQQAPSHWLIVPPRTEKPHRPLLIS